MDPVTYGGQAVIEGVMMKSRTLMATSVRRESGEIAVFRQAVQPWSSRVKLLRLPFFRGSLAMVESMILGYQSLTFSANQFAAGDGEGEGGGELKPAELALTMVLAFAVTIGLFIALPAVIIRVLQARISSNVILNLLEGLLKVTIFTIYLSLSTLLKDIKRVFRYHGAEHKTINAYEAGADLTPESVMRYSRIHKRCSTSFLFIVLLVSIFIFSFFGRPILPLRIALHIAILPVVAGISFELLFASAKRTAIAPVRWLTVPGLWLQRLTAFEPDESMVEVAIRSLREVLPANDPKSLAFEAAAASLAPTADSDGGDDPEVADATSDRGRAAAEAAPAV